MSRALLGPLYHLTDRQDRVGALREAARVVRREGLVVVAGISRFASLFDGLARGYLSDDRFKAIVERDLRDGQHRNPTNEPHWFTTAFFTGPTSSKRRPMTPDFRSSDCSVWRGSRAGCPTSTSCGQPPKE